MTDKQKQVPRGCGSRSEPVIRAFPNAGCGYSLGFCSIHPDVKRRDQPVRKIGVERRKGFQVVIAMTLSGLPDPPTIFSGAAMTTAPVGGS